MEFRSERDFLGEKQIPINALYGIHSLRAKENFPDTTPFSIEWYKSVGITKLACYKTYKKFKEAIFSKYGSESPVQLIDDNIIDTLIETAEEISSGKYFDNFIIPAIQGGAGTSINMNVNEIIANISLKKLGYEYGNYKKIDPIEHSNIFQSTNDVIPTALKVAILFLLKNLEEAINTLRTSVEKKEDEYRNVLRIAYTQMQEAVPSSYGKLFSTYSDALSRDWWRISKCFERIKTVNLGGSAIGSGITVPRFFIMEVINELQKLTNLPVTRGENLYDSTNNLDSLVEVHSIIKSHAVNLEKIASDIRLLSSDILKDKEIIIPQCQVGSSIMPGKINPVIPEFVISIAHKIYSNDILISNLCAQGCLELNAYLPTIGHSIIESLNLLIKADISLTKNLFENLIINSEIAKGKLYKSPAITTALIPFIGYNKASLISKEMKTSRIDIFEANKKLNLINTDKLNTILETQNLIKLGYSLNDID